MEIVYERVAGIDVHKRQITVRVRTPGARRGKRREQVRRYATFYSALREMTSRVSRWGRRSRIAGCVFRSVAVGGGRWWRGTGDRGRVEGWIVVPVRWVIRVFGSRRCDPRAPWMALGAVG